MSGPMFHASRRLRSLPLTLPKSPTVRRAQFSRSAIRSVEHESLKPYKVRFANPGLTPRRLLTFTLYSICITGYLWYFVPDVEIEVEVQDGQQTTSQRGEFQDSQAFEDSEYAEDDSFFIPLTWAWKLPRTWYKGSDPEWQEFVKIAKDHDKHKRINLELADIVYKGSVHHPVISKHLGKELKVGKYWLDISFPDGPPQEYARSGLEIGDDFIAFSTQRLSPEEQHRVTRALWPSAAFNGLYASSKVLFAFQFRRIKQALGLESTPEPGSPEAQIQHMLQAMEAQQQQQQGKLVPGGKAQADSGAGSGAGATSSSDAAASKPPFPWMARAPVPASSIEMPIAMQIFNSTLSKEWLPKKQEPPRGTFVVSGLIQVKGSRAVMTFDVQGFYEPKSSKFVKVNATPRLLKKWSQAPRGGK